MHRDTTDHRRTVAHGGSGGDAGAIPRRCIAGAAAGLLPWLAGCSSLPAPARPRFADHAVTALYTAPADGRIWLPVSDPDLTVLAMRVQPLPLREEFAADGRRWLVFPAGSLVRIEARLRSHARGDEPPAALPSLLPGARTIEPWSIPAPEGPAAR